MYRSSRIFHGWLYRNRYVFFALKKLVRLYNLGSKKKLILLKKGKKKTKKKKDTKYKKLHTKQTFKKKSTQILHTHTHSNKQTKTKKTQKKRYN